ncbi:MAG: Na+/H+ antiporter NhaC family protein [Bacillota bacterium]|nr:Na+/H+ antiporter NhaC family protein [Bacillota bacterium]
MFGTVWSLLPPIVAIVLALITKEVYSSLFIGIIVGALLATSFNPLAALETSLNDGFFAALSDTWNIGIFIFLVVLGIIVAIINKSGASNAYGEWAKTKIKSKRSALASTFVLSLLLGIDDYFHCLTVGSVMLPVNDSHNISRARFAYQIDATAAPLCMIFPISSWAAAVSGMVEGYNGIELFVKAIPYNFYSLLTLLMIAYLIVTGLEYGPMKKHEDNALKGDLFTTPDRPYENAEDENVVNPKATILDLVLPIVILFVTCVICMIYTGGFFSGASFIDAFGGCDASYGLSMGSIISLILILLFYLPRRILTFKQAMDCIPVGFKAMVPALLILTFALTLKNMTSLLGSTEFVTALVENNIGSFGFLLPLILFGLAVLISFSTGTSWGTFGILIPIVVGLGSVLSETMLIISISACLAGAVCGDHCSPISDTTIMASAGARCNHINHVSTQLPYALTVAAVSCVCYIIAGLTESVISLAIGIVLMFGTLFVIGKIVKNKAVVGEPPAEA